MHQREGPTRRIDCQKVFDLHTGKRGNLKARGVSPRHGEWATKAVECARRRLTMNVLRLQNDAVSSVITSGHDSQRRVSAGANDRSGGDLLFDRKGRIRSIHYNLTTMSVGSS